MEGLEIKKETFVKLDEVGRSEILFDYLNYMKTKLDKLEDKERREHSQLIAVGGIFGFLGGLMAVLGKWMIGQ